METEIAYWARFSKETLGSLDHGKNSLATFLDLATTFDPVFNCRLVKSIKDLGFDEVSFRWFSIYLHERQQCGKLDISFSGYKDVVMGISQGTVIGPSLSHILVKWAIYENTRKDHFLRRLYSLVFWLFNFRRHFSISKWRSNTGKK